MTEPGCGRSAQQTAPNKRKPLPRWLGEGLGTAGVHLKAEAETKPRWHDRVKDALPAIPRPKRPNAEPPVLSPQAERRSALAHADVGPLGLAPHVDVRGGTFDWRCGPYGYGYQHGTSRHIKAHRNYRPHRSHSDDDRHLSLGSDAQAHIARQQALPMILRLASIVVLGGEAAASGRISGCVSPQSCGRASF